MNTMKHYHPSTPTEHVRRVSIDPPVTLRPPSSSKSHSPKKSAQPEEPLPFQKPQLKNKPLGAPFNELELHPRLDTAKNQHMSPLKTQAHREQSPPPSFPKISNPYPSGKASQSIQLMTTPNSKPFVHLGKENQMPPTPETETLKKNVSSPRSPTPAPSDDADESPQEEPDVAKTTEADEDPETILDSGHLPEPEDMPHVEDDGKKPQYSYATLIGMAILRAPQRKLTLSAIYQWISRSFYYYRTCESGWQNSIRHNLSLNKAFVKEERPKGIPGKGNYWRIENGFENQFFNIRGRKVVPMAAVPTSGGAPSHTGRRQTSGSTAPKGATMKRAFSDDASHFTQSKRRQAASNVTPHIGAVRGSTPPSSQLKPLFQHADSGYLSSYDTTLPSDFESDEGDEEDGEFLDEQYPSANVTKKKRNHAQNLVSPPPSSPQRSGNLNSLPQTPAPSGSHLSKPTKDMIEHLQTTLETTKSPATALREHRNRVLRFLSNPVGADDDRDEDRSALHDEDDPWAIWTSKADAGLVRDAAQHLGQCEFDEDFIARACFGSPDKRENRRLEQRRSLVSGSHAAELYEMGSSGGVTNVFGVDVYSVVTREVERIRSQRDVRARPAEMERSVSSLF